jgi:hypothetical protein
MPCSPAIVPDDTNRDVYLVLDDFAVSAGHGARPTKRELAARRWSGTCSTGNMKVRSHRRLQYSRRLVA